MALLTIHLVDGSYLRAPVPDEQVADFIEHLADEEAADGVLTLSLTGVREDRWWKVWAPHGDAQTAAHIRRQAVTYVEVE